MRDLITIVLILSPILIFMAIYLVLLTNSNHKEKNKKRFDSDDSHIF
jgi:hypothetical protein